MKLNCLYAYNAAICLRKAIASVVDASKNLRNIPLDKYYIAFCENLKIIEKKSLCTSCEGCLDFRFLTEIWFEFIYKLEHICNDANNFVNTLIDKFLVPNEIWEKYYFILSLSEQKDFILKNYPDVDKDDLERISEYASTVYLNLRQDYYDNLISDCNDTVFHLYDVLPEKSLKYSEVELDKKKIIYFDTNVFSYYIRNKSFYSLVNLSKSNEYTYVYSPYILEDGIKSDRIHFLYDCDKLVELTDNKTILSVDDTFLIKNENVFDCAKRVHLFRDYTKAQEEKNVYKKKFYELTFLPIPNQKQNAEKLNSDFFSFFKNEVSNNIELKNYLSHILRYADNALELSDIIKGTIQYENLSTTIDGLFQFFDYIGYAQDSQEKTLKSNVQDLEHVKCATAADIFVTSDEKLYKRTSVIYALLGIKTKIMKENEFKKFLTKMESKL